MGHVRSVSKMQPLPVARHMCPLLWSEQALLRQTSRKGYDLNRTGYLDLNVAMRAMLLSASVPVCVYVLYC